MDAQSTIQDVKVPAIKRQLIVSEIQTGSNVIITDWNVSFKLINNEITTSKGVTSKEDTAIGSFRVKNFLKILPTYEILWTRKVWGIPEYIVWEEKYITTPKPLTYNKYMDAEGLLNYVRYGVVQLFRGVVVVSVSCYTAIKVDTSSGNPSGSTKRRREFQPILLNQFMAMLDNSGIPILFRNTQIIYIADTSDVIPRRVNYD
uniref:Uncharacterized protein n=1 Tax=Rhizophagus irregularis (strain DAOM 181602 / DAOM 197198 / MUCL 43194) TaxID=747089 RepID=U9U4T1_RHIID